MTSVREYRFQLDSPGQSMSWKKQVFLMFCTLSVYSTLNTPINVKFKRIKMEIADTIQTNEGSELFADRTLVVLGTCLTKRNGSVWVCL